MKIIRDPAFEDLEDAFIEFTDAGYKVDFTINISLSFYDDKKIDPYDTFILIYGQKFRALGKNRYNPKSYDLVRIEGKKDDDLVKSFITKKIRNKKVVAITSKHYGNTSKYFFAIEHL